MIVASAVDLPWSQYFCCVVAANREFVRKNPIATKRAFRAMLKATDICALEPERAAKTLVEGGFSRKYSLQTLKELPYAKWREYDPEDTVRFYALILHVSEDGRIHHLIDHLREVGRLAGLGCEIVTKYVRRIVKDANYML